MGWKRCPATGTPDSERPPSLIFAARFEAHDLGEVLPGALVGRLVRHVAEAGILAAAVLDDHHVHVVGRGIVEALRGGQQGILGAAHLGDTSWLPHQ